jgi:16S rRNA (cytosine967-C5)-methyltransferase
LLGLIELEGPDDALAIVAANNRQPPMWLRINTLRTSRADYLQTLADSDIAAQPADEPATAVLLEEPQPAAALPGYAEGLVSVQDAAAQLAAGYLRLQPGQRVLDACAAPGGKAAHILESCPQLDSLIAVDIDADRLAVVAANFERLGLTGWARQGDAGRPAHWWDGKPFDRILLDAPCSALGVIRRHPDIKVLRRPEDLPVVADQQARLITALWPLLAPGGRLVYVTCTITRRENQDQIEKFLHATGDAVLSGPNPESGRQICPGEANMDGFYYACLDKR